jgi:hypothetical protein
LEVDIVSWRALSVVIGHEENDGLLSSTSPHLSIWLSTSTREAEDASSTVIRFFTKANAIINDLVLWVTRSMAKPSETQFMSYS